MTSRVATLNPPSLVTLLVSLQLIEARNVLFFVMVMDGTMDQENLWNAMYNLRIEKSTFDQIQHCSAKLVQLSESAGTWRASKYWKFLRFYNPESLEIVRGFWRRYSSPENLTSSFKHNYNNAIKKIYEAYHKNTEPIDTLAASTKQFWKAGTSDLPNPLFAYSDCGSHFTVHPDSNPLAGFYLDPSVANIARDSQFYQPRPPGITDLEAATGSAKFQFEAWCKAFRRLVEKDNPPRLCIRFFVGDAISFCLGLLELRDSASVTNCYSRPGTTQPLRLKDYGDGEKRFDVIDTGYLVDRISLLNLVPHVAVLLQNSLSVVYTSTRVGNVAAERDLLERMLCGDVGVMCMLLGIVPAAYLTGNSSVACDEYHDSRPQTAIPLNNRIMWVMTKAGDHKLEFNRVSPTGDVTLFAKFLFDLYQKMFAFESSKTRDLTGYHVHTKYTFAALLRYFKSRIFIPWKECVKMLIAMLIEECERNGTKLRHGMPELFVQLALCDVYLGGVDVNNAFDRVPLFVASRGALGKRPPPDPCSLVMTVPRSILQPIYEKLSADTSRTSIAFQLYVRKEKCWDKGCPCKEEYTTVSCAQAVFGKLVTSGKSYSGTIEVDQAGWQGTSDLHVFGYFSTMIIRGWGDAGPLKFGVALKRTNETAKMFEADLGEGLSVFCTCLKHTNSVHFFDRLPGLKRPALKEFSFATRDRVAQMTNSFVVDFPVVDFEKPSFTTHVKVIGAALDRLQKKENLSVNQFSPCTLTITFGPFEVQGNYIFPVDGANARLRISRVSGWIEIIAPFIRPLQSQRGYFSSTPFPVLLSPWLMVYNTFLPYINFRQLPKLDGPPTIRGASNDGNEKPSIPTRLMTMSNNNELSNRLSMSAIKCHIHTLLFPYPSPKAINLKAQNPGDLDIVFFVVGLYLDPNSKGVVGEGFIMPMTDDVPKVSSQIVLEMSADAEHMIWWKRALPAMVEQARMWKHMEDCEFKFTGIPRPGIIPICSCGRGQVTSSFMDIKEWAKYAPYVTPVAISPIFPAPWLDSTRNIPEVARETRDKGGLGIEEKECKVCGVVGARKKCGKCMNVVYCSRECQVTDWREHKTACGSVGGG